MHFAEFAVLAALRLCSSAKAGIVLKFWAKNEPRVLIKMCRPTPLKHTPRIVENKKKKKKIGWAEKFCLPMINAHNAVSNIYKFF